MQKARKLLSLCAALILCLSLFSVSASAATEYLIGSRTNNTSNLYSGVDYDFKGYVYYNSIGASDNASYDYMLNVGSMKTIVTNRGVSLGGSEFKAEGPYNSASTQGNYYYNPVAIPTGAVNQQTTVTWSTVAGWFGRTTKYYFDSGEFASTDIGVLFNDYFCIGHYVSYWRIVSNKFVVTSDWLWG